MLRTFTRQSVAALGLVVAIVGTAWANGDDFFEPAPSDKPIDLVYVGHLRDAQTKELIKGGAYITVSDNHSGMTFPFTTDRPGHFRSPDIGLALKGADQTRRDLLEMRAVVSGYKNTTITKLPRKTTGVVDVTFFMERDGTPLAAEEDYYGTARAAAANHAPPASPVLPLVGGVATIMAGLGARTLGRRRSTGR
jgi:hypothetical protein